MIVAISIAGAASCLDFDQLSGSSPSAEDASMSIDDSSAPTDASNLSDVVAVADASDASFCAQNPGHSLCDDFDTPDFVSLWTIGTQLTPDATATQDPALFESSPYSLNATTAFIDAANNAWLATKFARIPTRVAVSFDLYIVTAGNSTVAITKLALPNGYNYAIRIDTPVPLLLDVQQVGPPVTDGGSVIYYPPGLSFKVETGQWYHVSFELPISGADAGDIIESLNDAAAISFAPSVQPTFDSGSVTLQAGVGSYSSVPYTAWSIRLDNYVFDLQ